MKKTLLLSMLLFVIGYPFSAFGQWAPFYNYITFDVADTLWRHAITIDTVHYHNNQWQVGRPQKIVFNTAYSPLNAIVTDTIHPYAPNDTSVFILTFPGNAFGYWFQGLNFFYQLNMDSTSLAMIDYSPDSGRTWINLHDSTPTGFYTIPDLHETIGWSLYSIGTTLGPDGPYYHNDSLMFRFTFIGGADTTGKDGWMIDNIGVLYEAENVKSIGNNQEVHLFPNPAYNECSLSYSGAMYDKASISVFDVTGREMRNYPLKGNNTSFYIGDLAPGLYWCKIDPDGKGILSRTLTVMR